MSSTLRAALSGLCSGILFFIFVSSIGNTWVSALLFPPSPLEVIAAKDSTSSKRSYGVIQPQEESEFLGYLNGNREAFKVTADYFTGVSRDSEIYFSRSTDHGVTFSHRVNVSKTETFSAGPLMTSDGNHLYFVWQELVEPLNKYQLYYTASHDNGNSFGNVINLSNTTGFAEAPQIQAKSGIIVVVWADNSSGAYQIFLRYSADQGHSFSEIYNLSNGTSYSHSPKITISDDRRLSAVWQGVLDGSLQILYRSVIFGDDESGSKIKEMSRIIPLSRGEDFPYSPQIIITENKNVYVVWIAEAPSQEKDATAFYGPPPTSRKVMFRASNDGGAHFGNVWLLSNNVWRSHSVQMSAEGQRVYVVWWGQPPYRHEDVFLRISVDAGQTFGRTHNLSNDAISTQPLLVVSGDIVYVSWRTYYESGRAYVISYDGGQNFTNGISSERLRNR